MGYRTSCRWLYRTSKGRKCSKRKTTMDGCENDCPLYEKKI